MILHRTAAPLEAPDQGHINTYLNILQNKPLPKNNHSSKKSDFNGANDNVRMRGTFLDERVKERRSHTHENHKDKTHVKENGKHRHTEKDLEERLKHEYVDTVNETSGSKTELKKQKKHK